jgi:predicted Fe-S protein YdhL (DUF1289 family)
MNTDAIDLIAFRARLAGVRATFDAELPVPSPCISVCRMDALTALCEGCWRTLPEIAGWSRMVDADKRIVWSRIEQRTQETST